MTERCWSGDGRPVEYRDKITSRGYCTVCAGTEFTSSTNVHMQFLADLLPFSVGEHVECRTMGEYWEGTGIIVRVSTELRYGGTPLAPAYLVDMDDRDEMLWFTPICLKRVKVSEEVDG